MAHSQKNRVLFIVEGEKAEPRIVNKISSLQFSNNEHIEIVDIRTNIYTLYEMIKKLNMDFEGDSTSTIEVLKELMKNKGRSDECEKLSMNFPYIYLLFDFEIQDKHHSINRKNEIIKEMQMYFCNESENGLLLINYPMIEAYKDYKSPLPYSNYKNVSVDLAILKEKKYKQLVSKRGNNRNIKDYSREDFDLLFLQNLCKANYIVSKEYKICDYDTFLELLLGEKIIDEQFSVALNRNVIHVLFTGAFFYVAYYGKNLFNKIVENYNNKFINEDAKELVKVFKY